MKTTPLKFLVLAVSLMFMSTAHAQSLKVGAIVKLNSVNYPKNYVKNAGAEVKIQPLNNAADEEAATFKVVKGLAGCADCISFESLAQPGFYLRHAGWILRQHRNDGSDLFRKDASFKVIPGLVGKGVSFESVNYPGKYLRHQGFVMKLHKRDGSMLFNKDASFVAVSAKMTGDDPADLADGNLFKNPGFNGSPCTNQWQTETVGVACNSERGTCWLNHNNRAGDPAALQTVGGLKPGATYEITVGWRGGDHGPIHGVRGVQRCFAIDLDGKEIFRGSTDADFLAWKRSSITFKATQDRHTIRFRGEVGVDGDVLLGWAKLIAR